MNLRRFQGKGVIVTGAGSGIGQATAIEFAGEGASVGVLDINAETARHTAEADGRMLAVTCDISDRTQCRQAVRRMAEFAGRVDALVNCAASFVAKGLDVTTEDWEESLGTNIRGASNMVQAVVEPMRQAGGGAVVHVSSISAHIAQPHRWTYNTCKAGLLNLTRCQALDLAPLGIRVNVVLPGWVWTPAVRSLIPPGKTEAEMDAFWGRFHMLRRLAQPREIARAILFLCSDDAGFITAAPLPVDGGYLGMGPEGSGWDAAPVGR